MEQLGNPVSLSSNNYEAELFGINLGLSYIEENMVQDSSILILCDCIPAMTASFGNGNYLHKDYNQVINDNKLCLKRIMEKNNMVKCSWVPGHKNVQINEYADSVAKDAASRCTNVTSKTPDRKNLLIMINEKIIVNWQFRVNEMLSDHRVFGINPRAGDWKTHKSLMGHPMYKIMKQLISGHHDLSAYKSKITGGSAVCKCGRIETLEHFLYFCERYSKSRFIWGMEVSNVLEMNSIPLKYVSWETLFGQKGDGNSEMGHKLCLALLNFLQGTKRFGN